MILEYKCNTVLYYDYIYWRILFIAFEGIGVLCRNGSFIEQLTYLNSINKNTISNIKYIYKEREGGREEGIKE